jgi:hypothetical protein
MSDQRVHLLIERGHDHENPLAVYVSRDAAIAAARERAKWPIARVGEQRFDYDEDTAHRAYVIEELPFTPARPDGEGEADALRTRTEAHDRLRVALRAQLEVEWQCEEAEREIEALKEELKQAKVAIMDARHVLKLPARAPTPTEPEGE